MTTKITPGHTMLRRWFAQRAHLVKAHEAEAMEMTKQQLSHLLSGRRKPTLDQAIAIFRHCGIAPYLWS